MKVSAWTNCPTLQKSDVSHPRQTRRGPTVLQSSDLYKNGFVTIQLLKSNSCAKDVGVGDIVQKVTVNGRYMFPKLMNSALEGCHFLFANAKILSLMKGREIDGVEYMGQGLEAGECGAHIKRVGNKHHGVINCTLTTLDGLGHTGTMHLVVTMREELGKGETLKIRALVGSGTVNIKLGEKLKTRVQVVSGTLNRISWLVQLMVLKSYKDLCAASGVTGYSGWIRLGGRGRLLHVASEEGEASSESASPVKAGRKELLTLRERTPPTTTVISCSRLDLSNYPCTPESPHLLCVMCRSWTSIRLPRFKIGSTGRYKPSRSNPCWVKDMYACTSWECQTRRSWERRPLIKLEYRHPRKNQISFAAYKVSRLLRLSAFKDLAAKGLRSEKERGEAGRGGRGQDVCSMLGAVGDDGETPSFDAFVRNDDDLEVCKELSLEDIAAAHRERR
ncbi:hypothetical protein J6590_074410 [Homalodisca vitripennis]|nr:hypothetical protein J6590_074410 [Homalodisca vitripennis]